jgi:hypothetical protein
VRHWIGSGRVHGERVGMGYVVHDNADLIRGLARLRGQTVPTVLTA